MKLFYQFNPAIIEWLKSPIVYVDDSFFQKKMIPLLSNYYSTGKGIYHYRSMAKKNYRGYLRDDMVPMKKYFYVLRPLLAVKWIEKYNESPPLEFEKLRETIRENVSLQNEINRLLVKKKQGDEKQLIPRIDILNNFIENEITRIEAFTDKPLRENSSMKMLNTLFTEIVDRYTDD